jgi:hypothetical protein
LPVSQAEIYKQLVAGGLVSPIPTNPWKPPFPAWYNPNARCAYHSDVAGHSIEDCIKLRQKIYELINVGSIKLTPMEQESAKTGEPSKVNNIASECTINLIEEDDQDVEVIGLFEVEICKP